jgi:hypothetical protein
LYEEIEWEVEEDAQFNPFDLGEPTASQLPEEMDAFLELYQQPPLGKSLFCYRLGSN